MKQSLIILFSLLLLISVQAKNAFCDYELRYNYDKQNQLTAAQLAGQTFETMPNYNHFFMDYGIYWFRLIINNTTTASQDYVIQMPTHNIGYVNLYQKNNTNTVVLLGKTYGILSNGTNIIDSRFPTFKVSLQENECDTLYFKTTFTKEPHFPFEVSTIKEYYNSMSNYNMWTALYYGLVVAVIIFNLFYFFKFRDKIHLLYIAFLISYTLALFWYHGIPRLFTTFDFQPILRIFMEITMLLFSYAFLAIDQHKPRFKPYAIGFVVLIALVEFVYLITGNFLFFALGDLVAMTSFLCVWIIALSVLKKVRQARFYVLGYFILLAIGFYCIVANDFGFMTISAKNYYLKIAGAIDIIIFTYAIIYKMEEEQKENQKIINELKQFLKHEYFSKTAKESDVQRFQFESLLQENSLSNTPLSEREIELLRYIYNGNNNNEIAEKMFISLNTVKFHIRNIYKKLEVKTRKEAIERLTIID